MWEIDERFTDGNEELPGLDLNAIVAALTALVQQQQEQIAALEARILALEAESPMDGMDW